MKEELTNPVDKIIDSGTHSGLTEEIDVMQPAHKEGLKIDRPWQT
jgi:hypothetical protein